MNIHDVAKKAGVSITTVSRVLNGSDLVVASTRARVLRVIEQLEYHPNVNARALSTRQNRTLGVIVSNLDNQYFVDVFRALEAEARRRGYEVMVADTDYCPDRLAKSVQLMLGRRVAGLAVVVSEMEQSLTAVLEHSPIPVAISGVEASGPNVANVNVNCEKGMRRLLDHLRSLGHERMAFLDHHSALESITERRRAFLDGTAAPSLNTTTRVFTDSDSFEGGRQAVRDMLSSGFQATAVVCVNDRMAVGALKELKERGLRVPEDISVTGFDNIALCEFVSPPLTTVHIPRDAVAQAILSSLLSAGQWRGSGRHLVVDSQLVVRESTGPART